MEVASNNLEMKGMNLAELISADELHKAIHDPPSERQFRRLNKELQEFFKVMDCVGENDEEREAARTTVMIVAWAFRRKKLI